MVNLIYYLLFWLKRRQRDCEMFPALKHVKDPILCLQIILTDLKGSRSEARVLSHKRVVQQGDLRARTEIWKNFCILCEEKGAFLN